MVDNVMLGVEYEPRCFFFVFFLFYLSEPFAAGWPEDVERNGTKDICRHFLLRGLMYGRGGARVGVCMPRGKWQIYVYCIYGPGQTGVLERDTNFQVADTLQLPTSL